MTTRDSEQFLLQFEGILADAAKNLRSLLVEVATSLRPFPSFMGMVSIQAVELEPLLAPASDLGCVVVNPEGEICRLDIAEISGISGLTDAEQVEEFQPLDLSALEYIVYANAAIEILTEELRRRGR